MWREPRTGRIRWGQGAALAVLMLLLAPAAASAAVNVSAVRFTCGYDAGANTMRPTVTLVRDRADTVSERRVRVSFRLFTDRARTAQLGAGPVTPGSDTVDPGTGRAVTGGPELAMRVPSGVAFGDAGLGGPALDRVNHAYVVEVEVFDFDVSDLVLLQYPCLGDADHDGLLDDWESGGIDVGGDGTVEEVDLPKMGAKPYHQDVFVEVDSMPGNHLTDAAMRDAEDAFAHAPTTNPDGAPGIALHVDNGPTSQMDPATGRRGARSAAPARSPTRRSSATATTASSGPRSSTR